MFEALIPDSWYAAVLNADTGKFIMLNLFLGAAAAAMFYGIFRFIHRIHIVRDTPTSKIRSAAQGYVELIGTARLMPGPSIYAPLTNKPCAWYYFKIEERRRSGKNSNWVKIEEEASGELFHIEDETGTCIIDPDGAEVTPNESEVWVGANRLDRNSSFFQTGDYRYTEKRINIGSPLYAVGIFRTLGASTEMPTTREDVATLLASWKANPKIMAAFDRNKDGEVDMGEWDRARKMARQEVKKQEAKRFAGPAQSLLSKPTVGRKPFILSVKSQDAMIQRYKIFIGLCISGFIVAGAVVSWMLSVRLLST